MIELVKRIAALTDEQALEAVNLLGGLALGATPEEDIRSTVAQRVQTDPRSLQEHLDHADPGESASLARVVLIAYAAYKSRDEVEEAISQTGQKAFLIEIAVIGLIGLGILQLVQSKGRKSEKHTVQIDVSANGDVTVRIEKEITYFSLGETLGGLAAEIVGGLLPPGA
ncbi:hypothetical protein [Streptomyces sp. NPDC093094]|uniref:hypothetical protein n=1 Tax=Streptomyces sp. NPDC093094 TaxID=3366026 RepID=UPI00380A5654